MRIVGLTGGIATGKSTVSRELRSKGLPIIDLDILAREVVVPGREGYKKVVAVFGSEILRDDGTIDRDILGQLVFKDAQKRRQLDKAVRDPIALELVRHLAWHWLRGTRVVVLDAPLLFESGLSCITSPIVVVSCSPEVQIERLVARSGMSSDNARHRMESQLALEKKRAKASYVIDNDGDMEELLTEVEKVRAIISRPLSPRERLRSREVVLPFLAAVGGGLIWLCRKL